MSVPEVDVTSAEFKAEAYAYYARLRASAPVHPVKLPSRQTVWLVSRYDDVVSLLKDPRLVKDRVRYIRGVVSAKRRQPAEDLTGGPDRVEASPRTDATPAARGARV